LFYLNKLNDLKVYSNVQVSSLEQSKNNRLSNLIFFSGNKEGDLINFINSNLFTPSSFRAVYIPKTFNTVSLNKKVMVDQQAFYDNIKKNCSNIINTKKALGDYKRNNLIFDLTFEYGQSETEIKIRGRKRISMYIDFLKSRMLEAKSYDKRVVVIPVPENITDMSYFDINKASNPFSYIYTAFRRRLLEEEQKKALENTTFIFYTSVENSFIKFTYNSDFDDAKISRLVRSLNTLIKITNHQNLDDSSDEKPTSMKELSQDDSMKKEIAKREKVAKVKNKILSQLNADDNRKVSSSVIELSDKIEDHITKAVSGDDSVTDKSEDEILDMLNSNPDLKDDVSNLKELQKTGGDDVKQRKTLEKLKAKQKELTLDNVNIQDIIDDFKSTSIDVKLIENTSVLQDETRKSNLKDFDLSYYEKQMKKDLISVISSFNNDSDVKLYIHDVKSEDTSDDLSQKMTYTVTFQDDRNVKHTVKFDYPIVKEGRFMYLNGGKKLILKQILLLPIVKTKPDTVQITTNYNKFFVMRFGSKLTHRIEKLKKLFALNLDEYKVSGKKFKARLGNALTINSNFETTLEYSELSSFLLELEDDKIRLMFSQSDIEDLIENDMTGSKKLSSIQYDSTKYIIVGHTKDNRLLGMSFADKQVYLLDGKTEIHFEGSLTEIVIGMIQESLTEEAYQKLSSFSNSKTLAYNRVKINNKLVPLIVLLGYELGLKNVLERYGIKYTFEEKNVRIGLEEHRDKIRFKDGWLIYDNKLLRNTLLLDGLSTVATEEYDFEEFEGTAPYVETFYNLFGSRNMGKGFHNTLSLMVDPITLDVLKQMKLPENIYDILLYANTLLEDTTYKRLNDMGSYRIRGAEQVNAFLYKMLADSFKTYKDTMKAGNPIKMSVPPDLLIKSLLDSPTVDEYSVLNPSLEIEKVGAATYKGLAGINLDNAYTKEIRAYDSTMAGIFAMSTPDSDKVGVVRQLTYDPSIKNTRGFLDTDRKTKNDSTNMYGPAELLSSFTGRHADPPRVGMQTTQQKHIIPTTKQSKPLFGSGVEKTVAYILNDDFVFRAKQDGTVQSIDEENEIAVIKYKDGTMDVIDLSENLAKNSNGGFYLANKKELIVKVGQKFKAEDILAKNPSYFLGDKPNDITYTTGKLCKVAISSADYTYEDSSIITESLSSDLSTKITMKKDLTLGVNANIDFIVKKGDRVKTGDPLVVYENSFEDASLNQLLDKLGSDFNQTISELSKNKVSSKYTGKIVDVVMYYNKDIEEFSPSVQKVLKEYIDDSNKKRNAVHAVTNDVSSVKLNPVSKQKSVKIKGNEVDGLLIEIYIEYVDELGVGDKITYYTALKTIVSDVIKSGEEPFSEFSPDENIEAIMSPLSIVSRMTIDIFNALYLNKALVHLKKEVGNIYGK
jgi:RNA polymerase Rpb2, domain 6